MKTVVGIFKTRQAASEGANLLKAASFKGEKVIVLTPDTPDPVVEKTVPTEDAEQPGMGKTIGSIVGGAVGLGAGALIATFFCLGLVRSWRLRSGPQLAGWEARQPEQRRVAHWKMSYPSEYPRTRSSFMRMRFDKGGR